MFPCPCLPHRWFLCVAFYFLRCPETQSRTGALTAQPCHLRAAFPPLVRFPTFCLRLSLQGDSRAGWVSPLHVWLCRTSSSPLWRGFVSTQGAAHVHFCSTLYQAAASDSDRADVTWLSFPEQCPWHLCTFMSVLLK